MAMADGASSAEIPWEHRHGCSARGHPALTHGHEGSSVPHRDSLPPEHTTPQRSHQAGALLVPFPPLKTFFLSI